MSSFICLCCGKQFPADPLFSFCPKCHEPMQVALPQKERCIYQTGRALERYRDFMPMEEVKEGLLLGEGDSPLLRLFRIEKKFSFPRIWAKCEMMNPTASFKDRGTVVAVHMAQALGIQRIGTVSTGNMSASTAAYGARAGMLTFVLAKQDTPPEKLYSAGIHGTHLIKVQGDYGKMGWESYRIGKKYGIYFMNSTDPFRLEGYKVIGYEICEQLEYLVPDHIFVPVSSGGHLLGLIKAMRELKQHGFIDRLPNFIGVQASGCAPIANAYASGNAAYTPAPPNSSSIAQSINNPAPPGGNILLKLIRQLKGSIISVSDEEIRSAQILLAQEEGLFCLPASATTLAGLLKLHGLNPFDPDKSIVLVLTGSGLKNIQVLDPKSMSIHTSALPGLDLLISKLIDNPK